MPKNILGSSFSTTFVGSSDHKVFNSKGQLIQGGKAMYSTEGLPLVGTTGLNSTDMVQAISYSSALVFATTYITSFGVTYIYPSSYTNLASSDRAQISLNAPFPGVRKTILYDGGSTNTIVDVALGAVGILGTSDWAAPGAARFIHFSSVANGVQVINLIGISTSLWAVEGISVESTAINCFNEATGIRTSTAVRTS